MLPIDSVRVGKDICITYPDTYQDRVNIIYDKDDDHVTYGFAAPPKKYPEVWDPYNTKY